MVGPRNDGRQEQNFQHQRGMMRWFLPYLSLTGVLSQATKNKTYTPKNICSSMSKDCSYGKYLAQFMLREQGGGVEYNENNFKKKKKTTKEQFKLKY